jgi:hypothetical protein
MKKKFQLVTLAIGLALVSACSQNTNPPECTEASDLTIAGKSIPTDLVKQLQGAIGTTANASENEIREAAHAIKAKFPSATSTETVDLLIAAYCPAIDPQGRLSTSEQDKIQTNFMETANQIVSGTAVTN